MSGAQIVAPSFSPPQGRVSNRTATTPTGARATASNNDQTVTIPVDAAQERRIIQFARTAQETLYSSMQLRAAMEEIDKQYQREKNWTQAQLRARIANRVGDAHKLQDVTVPIVMPQVEACLTYLTNVFLTGYPIFGVSASPDQEDVALMLETVIAENSITAGWVPEILRFFRDGLKYNIHCLEVTWDQKTVWSVDNDISMPNNAKPKKVLWNGNSIRRIDLYNAFWDYRVHPFEVADHAEFAGYTRLYSRVRMLQFLRDYPAVISEVTIKRAMESPIIQTTPTTGGLFPFSYFQPVINPFPTMSPANSMMNMNWMAWAMDTPGADNVAYKDAYTLTTCYGRILPGDFGFNNIPGDKTPQVWKFLIVNGSVCVAAERQSNAHSKIPMFFGQPLSDGLDYQTKSFAQNVVPMQEVSSALWNGFIASKRRLVTDRVLYDPSRVRESDINSPNPSAKIPVRSTAYGKPLGEAVYQFPYRDEQATSFILAARETVNFANMINNQNPAQQGQFVKGNKTLHEYEDTMSHGNGSNQMMAINIEGQVFTPIKEVLKLNILQFQPGGEVFNANIKQNVAINQTSLRRTVAQFKVSDGLLPTDKEMSTDEFITFLQQVGSNPQIAAGFNLAPLLTYIMKLKGADISPFAKSAAQLQFEQQIQAWQQTAMEAFKQGAAFSTPMPTPSPQLQQEMQQQQQTGGINTAVTGRQSTVLANTQGAA